MKVHLTAQDNTWMMHHDAKTRMLKEGRYPDETEMLMQTPSPPDTTQVEAWLQGTPRVEPSQIHIVVVWPKLLDFRVKDISEVFGHNALDRTLTYRRGLSFHVFIRESYAVIADRVLKEDNSVVPKYATVIGTPGIGKSYFRYLMWRLLSEKRRVFLFHEGGSVYFDGECLYDGCNVPGPLERFFWTPDLWCLVDATNPKERLDIHVANVSVVLTTTSRENFVDHMRALRPAPLSFVMPVWTESELAAIESWYPAAQRVWRDRLRVLGGVPRYVMEDISEAPATSARSRNVLL
ncbi:hypothetical protein Poli38472_012733 [Pythium oligandrum]|uniref:Uncharacterized protein n=1 Tax=Pythium oligandrum TaxID=41045 RepID=A0A8K1CG48_PYTOL|nr:hypothetical protein Poli38472_012733 [Pythium oligandrum]|eukprot:TMW61542.1 hypothetical protein Poli38472_012733 [Pythium oligandrum]